MRTFSFLKIVIATVFMLIMVPAFAAAQYGYGDQGQYQIVSARYGTERSNVDVTGRLRELAREDIRFRMGNSTFGVDPDPGAIKMLRIYARGPRGENRTFEYREGSTIDGSQFTGWGRGDWGRERWDGRWGRGDRDRDDDDRDDRRGNDGRGNGYGDRDNGRYDSASITILQATYGAGRYRRDVTNVLRNYVRDGRLVLTVSNESMGGDPAPNMRKNLTITYRTARGDQRQANVTEGGRLNLQ